LPESGGRMNRIVAKTNVVIDFTDDHGQTNHATSDKAVYSIVVQNGTTNGWVTLTGHAVGTNAAWTITAEPIKYDVETRHTQTEHLNVILTQTIERDLPKTNPPRVNRNDPAQSKTNLPPGSVEGVDEIIQPSGGGHRGF